MVIGMARHHIRSVYGMGLANLLRERHSACAFLRPIIGAEGDEILITVRYEDGRIRRESDSATKRN